jgi:2-C-methyl-D-erythritol 4-phosphate cytidylyltransferase / 2-C-methyl-D-erythritol 2,4-cyclodiphosphate synthase
MEHSKIAAVIVAAGSGLRFGKAKQLELLGGVPLYRRVVDIFKSVSLIDEVILVHSDELAAEPLHSLSVHTVRGGATRQASVFNGVQLAQALGCKYVLVHDAARALVSTKIIEQVATATLQYGAAIAACPVVDTLKLVADETIVRTLPRENLWRAQTPQGCSVRDLAGALNSANETVFTDEAHALESVGIPVHIVESSELNFKITFPEDLSRARRMLGEL